MPICVVSNLGKSRMHLSIKARRFCSDCNAFWMDGLCKFIFQRNQVYHCKWTWQCLNMIYWWRLVVYSKCVRGWKANKRYCNKYLLGILNVSVTQRKLYMSSFHVIWPTQQKFKAISAFSAWDTDCGFLTLLTSEKKSCHEFPLFYSHWTEDFPSVPHNR